MKKYLPAFLFSLVYALLLSALLVCFLRVFGIALAVALDGSAVTGQYPRFLPFCLIAGAVSLALAAITFLLNRKAAETNGFIKRFWWTEAVAAVVCAVPLVPIFELLLSFLQETL